MNLVSVVQATRSTVALTLLDGMLVHRRYRPNNVGTHLQVSVLRQIGVMKLSKFKNQTTPSVRIKLITLEF